MPDNEQPSAFLEWLRRDSLAHTALAPQSWSRTTLEQRAAALSRSTFVEDIVYHSLDDDSVTRRKQVERARTLNALGVSVAMTVMWDGREFRLRKSYLPDTRYGRDAAMTAQLLERVPLGSHARRVPDGYQERVSFHRDHHLTNYALLSGQLVGNPAQRLTEQAGQSGNESTARAFGLDAVLDALSIMAEPVSVTLIAEPLPAELLDGLQDFLLTAASLCASGEEVTLMQSRSTSSTESRSELDPEYRLHRAALAAGKGVLGFAAGAAALAAIAGSGGLATPFVLAAAGGAAAAASQVDFSDLFGWRAQVQVGSTTTETTQQSRRARNEGLAFYAEKLNEIVRLFDSGGPHGLWSWAGIVAAQSKSTAKGVADIYAGRMSLLGNSLQPIRVRDVGAGDPVAGESADVALVPQLAHPVGVLGQSYGSLAQSQSLPYLFATPTLAHAGVRVIRHVPVSISSHAEPPALSLGVRPDGYGDVSLSLTDMTGHLLVCGRTGSGKTLLTRRLLRGTRELEAPIPFVFLDMAQTLSPAEWDFAHRPLFFEGGREFDEPFPSLGLLDFGSPAEYHHHNWLVSDLLANWLPSEGPLPLLLSELIQAALSSYVDDDQFWLAGEPEVPSLADLQQHIDVVFEGFGDAPRYEGELRSNLRGALLTRLRRLTSPGMSSLLDGTSSGLFQALAQGRDLIVSLARSGSTNERCFLALVMLTKLRQWLRGDDTGLRKDRPRLVVVVDEAHILLRKVAERDTGTQSNIHAYAVKLFDELMAEIRQLGAAVVILDQSPALLADSVLFSTANKVVFALASGRDMRDVGEALPLPADKHEALGTLPNRMAYLRAASNPDLQLFEVPLPPDGEGPS